MNEALRIGIGYDVHRLVKGSSLRLGGVDIPFSKKAAGHSDADVLIHAICDALLGALALGDIGKHFPDNDSKYKNIDSTFLLKEVVRMLNEKNYYVLNVDAVVLLEEPKIAPFIATMQQTIASILRVEPNQVSVKATTGEKLGFVGKGRGIAAQAVALLAKK